MKIVATSVGTQCPVDSIYNSPRMQAAKQALEKSKKLRADVLVLPGGYFTADDCQSRQRIAESLANEAERLGVAVVFGVDEYNAGSVQLMTNTKAKVQKQTEEWWPDPMYGYAWSTTEKKIHCWRQRSISSGDQWSVPADMCEDVRMFMIGAESLGVLICGEIFNQRIRDALRNHKPEPKVVADLGHKGFGFRVHNGMKPLGEGKQGIASMCSLHNQSRNAKKRYYIPGEGYMSTSDTDDIAEGPPRIEMKILEF